MLGLGLGVNLQRVVISLINRLLSILKGRSTYFENESATKSLLNALNTDGLLEKASILITPTAYSDGKINSVKPIEATADLNFTRGSGATRTNEQGLVENSQGNNTPRINYKDGVGSWLIEPQSTNLVEYSESFDNSYWTKSGATVTSGFSAPSVDSPLGAFKLVFDGSGRNFYTSFASTSGTSSGVYVKGTYGETIQFGVAGGDSLFTLSGEWQRLESYLATSATIFTLNTYGGATARELYIFGAQLEEQSYATSYIKTEGSTQTRLAETANRSGLGDLIDSTQGVFYAEISALADDLTAKYITISDGTNTNRIILSSTTSSNGFRAQIVSGGSSQAEFFTTFTDITDFNKVAFKYKLNSFSMFVNGVKIGEDLVGSVFSANSLNSIKYSNADGSVPFYGNIKAVSVFPILTDEELTYLTTI